MVRTRVVRPRRGGGAAALGIACLVLVGGCASRGEEALAGAVATARLPQGPARACEVSSSSADIGTTRMIRCREDVDGDDTVDAIEVTRRTDYSSPPATCGRSERRGDVWRQVGPCIPER